MMCHGGLQIQPDKEIIIEYIKNEDFKYVRMLGGWKGREVVVGRDQGEERWGQEGVLGPRGSVDGDRGRSWVGQVGGRAPLESWTRYIPSLASSSSTDMHRCLLHASGGMLRQYL